MLFVRGESDAGVELWAGGTFDVEDGVGIGAVDETGAGVELWAGGTFDVEDGVGIGAVDETGTDVELDTFIAADEKPFVNIYKEN